MRTPGTRLRWASLAAVSIAVVLTAALGSRFGSDPSVVASPLIGRPAPDLTLPYLEQEGSVSLEELEGSVVVVNFWASWCLECRIEHPDLVRTAARYRPAGVRFLGVAFNDPPEQAVAMLDELGRGYDYVVDPGSRAAIEFGVFGVPETFFIDPEGRIVAKITGPSDEATLSGILDRIFLGEEPGATTTGTVRSGPEG